MTTESTTTTGDATTQAQGAGTGGAATTATTGATGTTGATTATSTTTESGTSTTNGGAQTTAKEGEGTSNTSAQAPEKYEFTAVDGIELEPTAVSELSAIAKDLKLSQADAQKIADVGIRLQQRQLEQHANTVKGWVDQSKTDKEFGGDAFDANLGVARKAIETFGSKELTELLDATGFGNHPAVIRAFWKAGKAISEGSHIAAGARTATPGGQSVAQVLYPGMNP